MSTERKFTDRDIRDGGPILHQQAVAYLQNYTGEFDLLIDCKMRVSQGMELTVGMVRGVLNCMRNDPRVKNLPKPKDWSADHEAEVIQIRPLTDRCPDEGTEHNSHWYPSKQGGQRHCNGWHSINRSITYTRARFHAPYLRGRASNLIHRSTHVGEVVWFPRGYHKFGQAEPAKYWVGTMCPIQNLNEPSLLDAADVRASEPYKAPTSSMKYKEVTLCARCFPGTILEEIS